MRTNFAITHVVLFTTLRFALVAGAQERRQRRPGAFGGPIVLQADDKPAFDDPPTGFDVARPDIMRGKLEMIEYDSKTVGTRRKMQVYTPPGYSSDQKYHSEKPNNPRGKPAGFGGRAPRLVCMESRTIRRASRRDSEAKAFGKWQRRAHWADQSCLPRPARSATLLWKFATNGEPTRRLAANKTLHASGR